MGNPNYTLAQNAMEISQIPQGSKTPVVKPLSTIQKPANSAQEQSSQRHLLRTIQKALSRKTISTGYHTNMPVFLKSEGPFSMYDHSLRHIPLDQDGNQMTVVDQASLQALRRYEQELIRLKELREKEKAHFVHNIELGKAQAREAYKERMINLKQNQQHIAMQMDWNATQRAQQHHIDKQYYKPHFGPEETQEIVAKMRQTELDKTAWQYDAIQEQLAD